MLKDSSEKVVKVLPTSKFGKKIYKQLSKENEKQIIDGGFLISRLNNNATDILSKKGEKLGTIRGNVVTASPGYSAKAMNSFLDVRKLLPNFTYKVENVIYKTDDLGRKIEASVSSFPKSISKKPRSSYRQGKGNFQNNGFLDSDQGGHVIPSQLGGASEAINIFPQNKFLNTGRIGKWREMEKYVYDNRKFIKDYKIRFIYEGVSHRPKYIQVSFLHKGEKMTHNYSNEIINTID